MLRRVGAQGLASGQPDEDYEEGEGEPGSMLPINAEGRVGIDGSENTFGPTVSRAGL